MGIELSLARFLNTKYISFRVKQRASNTTTVLQTKKIQMTFTINPCASKQQKKEMNRGSADGIPLPHFPLRHYMQFLPSSEQNNYRHQPVDTGSVE